MTFTPGIMWWLSQKNKCGNEAQAEVDGEGLYVSLKCVCEAEVPFLLPAARISRSWRLSPR